MVVFLNFFYIHVYSNLLCLGHGRSEFESQSGWIFTLHLLGLLTVGNHRYHKNSALKQALIATNLGEHIIHYLSTLVISMLPVLIVFTRRSVLLVVLVVVVLWMVMMMMIVVERTAESC